MQKQSLSSKAKKAIRSVVVFLLTILSFYLISFYVDFNKTFELMFSSDIRWYVAIVIMFLIMQYALNSFRWWVIMRFMDIKMGYWPIFYTRLVSTGLNIILPLKGGEILQIAYLNKFHKLDFAKGMSIFFFNRYTSMFVMVIYSLIGVALYRPQTPLFLIFALFLFLTLFMSERFVSFMYRVSRIEKTRFGDKFTPVLSAFRDMSLKHRLIVLLLIALPHTFLGGLGYYMSVRAVGCDINPFEAIFLSILAILVGSLPITASGLGTRDAALLFLLSPSLPNEAIMSASLLFGSAFIIPNILISLPLAYRFIGKLAEPKSEADAAKK